MIFRFFFFWKILFSLVGERAFGRGYNIAIGCDFDPETMVNVSVLAAVQRLMKEIVIHLAFILPNIAILENSAGKAETLL